MDVKEVIDLIDTLEYKPGWHFHGFITDSHGGVVTLNIAFRAPNSDVSFSPRYDEKVSVGVSYRLFVEDVPFMRDVEDMIADCILRAELHEIREFIGFRKEGGLDKPYHPHTKGGVVRWRHRSRTASYGADDTATDLLGLDGTF